MIKLRRPFCFHQNNYPQELSPLILGLYISKYEAKGIYLELVKNDGEKSFKMLPELVLSGCMPMPWGSFSNDDPGLILTIFMTGSNLFPDVSVWLTAYTAVCAHVNVFPSLF